MTPEEKKKMNKTNAQAFTKCKTKLKKYLAEVGDNENLYEAQVKKYRADPPADSESDEKKDSSGSDDDSDDSDSDSSSSEESSDEKPKAKDAKKAAPKKKAGSDSSSSESSGSNSSSDSDSDSDSSNKSGSDSEAEEEEEVLKAGQLPKKYTFLALAREDMIPEQRRWKWVAFEKLPEDMKQYIRPPKISKKKDKDDKKDTKVKVVGEIKETEIEIQEDRDLDFTKMDNVESILTKYKNQQTNRKNFDLDKHIEVFDLILKAQAANTGICIEVTMLITSTYLSVAKQSVNGYFNREMWIKTNSCISSIVKLLKSKVLNTTKVVKDDKDEGGDLDSFLQSSDAQILPALVNFIEKLDQQLYKAF